METQTLTLKQQEMKDRGLIDTLIEEVVSYCVMEKGNDVKCSHLNALDHSRTGLADERVEYSYECRTLLAVRAETTKLVLQRDARSNHPAIIKLCAIIGWATGDQDYLRIFDATKAMRILN